MGGTERRGRSGLALARFAGMVALLIAPLCLGLAACGGATGDATPTAAYHTPLPATAVPTSSFTLACTMKSAENEGDDETAQTLTCAVKHVPATDTHFALHYAIRDPAGSLRPFEKLCEGTLKNGVGACSQVYEFTFPFAPVPGPVTGESLPSHTALGPVRPTL